MAKLGEVLDLGISPKGHGLKIKLLKFIEEHYLPAMPLYHQQYEEQVAKYNSRWISVPVLEDLKSKAKEAGLWNLFLQDHYLKENEKREYAYPSHGGLSNVDYAQLAEIMGRYHLLSEVCNCSAPDTGNMEVLAKYGNASQKQKWLKPLMNGEIRSVFFMTEPKVASSDATNIETSIRRDGDSYVINGRKWWSSGVLDPRCTIGILMGKTDFNTAIHKQQSMILVPMDAPGIKVLRACEVFGWDDAPHGHGDVVFENVRVPKENLLLGEGRGFEIAQGRLGPGRIHHCMRVIGIAEAALDLMVERSKQRTGFGRQFSAFDTIRASIADARTSIEMMRLLTLKAAAMIDKHGDASGARAEISMIKVAVPNLTLKIIDDAIQVHGGAGVCQDFPLAAWYAGVRTLRLADGPDEVHRRTIAKMELDKHQQKNEQVVLYQPPAGADLRPSCVKPGGLLYKGDAKL